MGSLLGWPQGRGAFTIWAGHVMLCMAYVVVIVQSRVHDLDRSLEEAALDLGAPPLKVFFAVVLPQLAPALLAAWLLSFTPSLAGVVIVSFRSGAGSSSWALELFSRGRLGLQREVSALAAILIGLVAVGMGLAHWIQHRRAR